MRSALASRCSLKGSRFLSLKVTRNSKRGLSKLWRNVTSDDGLYSSHLHDSNHSLPPPLSHNILPPRDKNTNFTTFEKEPSEFRKFRDTRLRRLSFSTCVIFGFVYDVFKRHK